MNSSELADKKQVDHDGAIDDTEDEDNSTQCSDFISLLDESFDVLNAGRTHQSFHESYQGWIYGNGGTRKRKFQGANDRLQISQSKKIGACGI